MKESHNKTSQTEKDPSINALSNKVLDALVQLSTYREKHFKLGSEV